MPLKIQTCWMQNNNVHWLGLDCRVLLMIIAWSAICNHNCIFPEVFVVILNFSFILGFVVGGVYNSVP